MKLVPIEPAEISAFVTFRVTCFLCAKSILLHEYYGVDDVIHEATNQGWHGYETKDETCSTACPSCIKTIQEEQQL